MKKYTLIAFAMFSMLFAACGAKQEPAKSQNNANSGNSSTAAKPAEDSKPADSASKDSPTAVMTAFIEALKKKDAETIKKNLSKSSVEKLEESAKAENTTIDKMLSDGEDLSNEKMPEMKNEKIEGDTATLEVQDEKTKKWDSVPFVKEDGAWKIAFDKMKF